MKATVNIAMTFEASNSEDALKKVADHFAMMARLSGNGMKFDTKADWFEGSITVDLKPAG